MNKPKMPDPLGQAIYNYYTKTDNTPVTVNSSAVESEKLPPDYFFRKYNDMPLLERIAMKKSNGRILDVGAGAGCHSIYLQQQNKEVYALESSELCCKVLKSRGLKNVINTNIFDFTPQKKFDTILLLMNGTGIAGDLEGLLKLIKHLKTFLTPEGCILIDSSDLIYLYEQEDGTFFIDINAEKYYGEIDYQITYKKIKGEQFSWLFADNVILQDIASQAGLKTKIVEYGPHYDYLAELTIHNH